MRWCRSTAEIVFDAPDGFYSATRIITYYVVSAQREVLKGLAFPASLTLSMPFWLLNGQSGTAQGVMIGGTLMFLVAVGFLASIL